MTVLHNFDSSHPATGYHPVAGLVSATDGNLYGATGNDETGGLTNLGLLFRLSQTGLFTGLRNFAQWTGKYPDATSMQHTNGKLYGLTRAGGSSDSGVLYSLDVGLTPFVAWVNRSGKVGALVEMLGNGFAGTNSVKFGSATATFTVVNDTYLTAIVPAAATTGLVKVTTPSHTLPSSKQFRVFPAISGFAPTGGPVGTQVLIKGSGLLQARTVTFGGASATFTVDSAAQLTATVPATAKTGKIAVATPGGVAKTAANFTLSTTISLGRCVVLNNALTGYCVGARGGICHEAYDPTHCLPGQVPTTVVLDQCAQSSFHAEGASACTP